MTNRQGRTLRSPRLRALIWRSQDGICAICHKPMRPDEDWEIDHAEPWRITHRTNIYELQAVHRKCNREKGGKVDYAMEHPEMLRKGQLSATELIKLRVKLGRKTTAIVAPCRYGKANIIRIAAVELWATGIACTGLGLSPGTNLRDQLGEWLRWNQAFTLYGIKTRGAPSIATIDKPKAGIHCKYNPNGEAFLSTTIQFIQQNLDSVRDWAESEAHRTGLPVIVFIDECHSASIKNEWGQIVPVLTEAGAHVVLLTATPERADFTRIPGFEFDEVNEEDITIFRCRPHQEKPEKIIINQLEGRKTKLVLRPDLTITFGEAWREVTSNGTPILCKISRTPFDVELSKAAIKGENVTWLSEIDSPAKVRRYLGKLVRQEIVIREGCFRLLLSLRARWNLSTDFQAIIYCGNDIEPENERELNKHAEKIRSILLQLAGELLIADLDVRIATSENNGGDIIKEFAGINGAPGKGHILIVKQMAGMGIDFPWVKVGLDLSPTRTFGSLVQRMFRPATPHADAVTCEWITPDDVLSAIYFKRVVQDEGGEAQVTDLTLVDSWEKDRKDGPEPDVVIATAVRPGSFDDSGGRAAGAEEWERVGALITRAPKITSIYTHAELASIFGDMDFSVPEGEIPDGEASSIQDTSVLAGSLREAINETVKGAVNRYMRIKGLSFKDNYSTAIEYLWKLAKKEADWPLGVALDESNDLDALHRIKVAAEELCGRSWD